MFDNHTNKQRRIHTGFLSCCWDCGVLGDDGSCFSAGSALPILAWRLGLASILPLPDEQGDLDSVFSSSCEIDLSGETGGALPWPWPDRDWAGEGFLAGLWGCTGVFDCCTGGCTGTCGDIAFCVCDWETMGIGCGVDVAGGCCWVVLNGSENIGWRCICAAFKAVACAGVSWLPLWSPFIWWNGTKYNRENTSSK